MMTLRIDEELEQKIEHASVNLGISKSELLRRSVQEFIAGISKPDPWEVGKDLFGKHRSGRHDLSTNRKTIIRDLLSRKHK
jgi:negative regulator of replication initiation